MVIGYSTVVAVDCYALQSRYSPSLFRLSSTNAAAPNVTSCGTNADDGSFFVRIWRFRSKKKTRARQLSEHCTRIC